MLSLLLPSSAFEEESAVVSLLLGLEIGVLITGLLVPVSTLICYNKHRF